MGGTLLTEQNVERITNLILSYFRAVDHVCQNHKLPKEEKLERLLYPLIELNKLLAPVHSLEENPYRLSNPYRPSDDTYPFISERVWKDDLDLEYLEYDKDKYEIDWCENQRIPERRGPRIWIIETAERKRLHEEAIRQREIDGIPYEESAVTHSYPQDLYPEWLPSLDEERIQNKDLLDQILVCFTIKRAMNGNEKAIEKLYSLYEDAAEGLGANFAKLNNLPFSDVKETSKNLLRFIIKGFLPENILMDLLSDQKILSIPGWVKDFFIYYLSQYLPPIIKDTLIEAGSIQRDGQRDRFIFLYFRLLAMLNPYTPIRDIPWKNSPVRIRRFNNYCFRPGIVKLGPHKNLTTWIFGRRNEIDTLTKAERENGTTAKAFRPYGKLYQLIRDTYKPDIKRQKVERSLDAEGNLSIRDKAAAVRDNRPSVEDEIIDQETIGRLNEKLSESGISSRDIEIFTEREFERIQQIELAKKYHLSTRQIRRICERCKETLYSSLKSNLSFRK